MRNLTFICAFFAFALPGAALARPGAPGDGTLLIKDGIGKVTITAKGGVIGHFGEGVLTIRDPNPDDNVGEVVTGATRSHEVNSLVTRYWGKNVSFRYIGGKFTITLVGNDIDLSAIGRGIVQIVGRGTADDGTFSVNSAVPQPFPGPFFPTTLQLSSTYTG